MEIRGHYIDLQEPLFIFPDRSPVKQWQARRVLKDLLTSLDLDASLYGMHSFRIGHATDMYKFGYSVETIKKWGRWHSNAVYRYLCD